MKKKKVVKLLDTSGKNEMTALVHTALPSENKRSEKAKKVLIYEIDQYHISNITDILDPAYKKLIINLCNFYHEKTGVWINMMSEGDKRYIEQYGYEFYQKYGNTIPESIKREWSNNIEQNKWIKALLQHQPLISKPKR